MIEIRLATEKDSTYIIDFQQRLAMETEGVQLNIEKLTEGLKRMFDDPLKGKYYVAETDGQVIGCLMTTYEWSEWRCSTILWIQSVYIVSAFRSKSVFRKMYEHIQGLITPDSDICGIRLYVDKNNTAAQQVYSNPGMNGEHYQLYEWMV